MTNRFSKNLVKLIIIIASTFIALYLTCLLNEITLTTNLQRLFVFLYFETIIILGLFLFKKKNISTVSLMSQKVPLFIIAIISLVLCLTVSSYIIPKNYSANKITLTILEEKNYNSQGQEVRLTGVKINGNSKNIIEYVNEELGWSYQENALYGNVIDSKPLNLFINKAKKIELQFVRHQWSGIIQIANGEFKQIYDLYDKEGDTLNICVPVSFSNYSNGLIWGLKAGLYCLTFLLLYTVYLIYQKICKKRNRPNTNISIKSAISKYHKEKSIFIFLWLFLGICILFSLLYYNKTSNDTEIITISGTNTSNEVSLGNEVWFTTIKENGQSRDINNYIVFNDGWSIKENAYFFDGIANGCIKLKINTNSKVELEFTKHPWSGKVNVEDSHGIRTVDLYDPNGNTYNMTINTNYYKILIIKFIILILSSLFLIRILCLTKIRLWKNSKIDISILIIFLIIIRLLYLFKYENIYSLFADSDEYIAGVYPGLRTPMYFWIIKSCKLLWGNLYLYGVVLVQNIVGIFSAICLFLSLKKHFNYKLSYFVSLYYGILPSLVNYEYCILSDSLSVTLLVIAICLMLCYLKEEKLWQAISINICAFFLLLLRPTNIILGIVLIPFWLLRTFNVGVKKRSNLSDRLGLVGLIIYYLGIIGYCYYSYYKIGYFGISTAGHLNVLITLIMNNLYYTSNYESISQIIDTTYHTGGDSWTAFSNVLDYIHNDYDILKQYLDSCIYSNFLGYISYNVKYFVDTIFWSIGSIYAECKDRTLIFLNYLLLPVPFLTVFVTVLWEFIYSLYTWIKKGKILWISLGLSSIGIAYLISGILGAPIEAQRHSISVIPLFILIITIYLDKIIQHINSNK